jgi:tetratricopeptide (TPR) repeat protein
MFNGMLTEERRSAKSLLSGVQRGWLAVALVLAGLLLANTLYLLANRLASAVLPGVTAERVAEGTYTVSKLFQVMVLSHTGLGFLVTGLLLAFALWHLPTVWRRHRRRTVTSGLVFLVTGLILAITGPFIMYAAASREHGWVWWTHVVAAAIVPAAYIIHRMLSYVPAHPAALVRFGTLVGGATVVLFGGHVLGNRDTALTPEARLAQAAGSYTGAGSKARDLSKFVEGPYVPVGFVPPASPFFPSAATTTTGDYLPERIITRGDVSSSEKLAPDLERIGFVVNEKIGADTCERCHADIVEQWSKSAHRFASFNNPFYEATINDMREKALSLTKGVAEHVAHFPQWQERTGKIKSKWCSGCHDPSVMLAGQMTEDINRRTPQAQAGLTCLACHAIDKIHNVTGDGAYNIADEHEDPYVFARAETGSWEALLHDTAVKAKPEAHKRQMLQPFFRTAEFCSACHKVSLPEPVNDYRWFRGQNEYDNWHDSGVALNASRTFYLPPAKRVCQDCHMPLEPATRGDVAAKNGNVRSHRFLAINTALPYIRGDEDTIKRIEAFLRDNKLRIDVFALEREHEGKAGETNYALDKTQPSLTPGERVTFDVVVRNKDVGHTFPGGTNDSNEGWIEFTILDANDRVLYQSGAVGEDGYVDPGAHYFRALVVDRHSEPIHRRNAQDMYAAVYTSVIGPGTAHTVHYAVEVPDLPGEAVKVRARLMWRKFDRAYTEFAFNTNRQGFKRFEKCPDLPITEICRSEIMLPIARPGEPTPPPREVDAASLAADWMRFNDYGIGLFLQSDTKGAERAFAEVARLAPKRIDGPRNLARVALSDGNLPTAYEHLLRCEELASNDPQTAWFWGVLLQEDGRYVEAASAYKRVLQRFPDDRATWRNLGRTYYLDAKFEQAIEAFNEVLRIDPEDRVAHYHVMLSARALGRTELAASAEAAYLRYKIDESGAEVTQTYRLSHPDDNRESQAVHVHDLSAPRGHTQRMTEASLPAGSHGSPGE